MKAVEKKWTQFNQLRLWKTTSSMMLARICLSVQTVSIKDLKLRRRRGVVMGAQSMNWKKSHHRGLGSVVNPFLV